MSPEETKSLLQSGRLGRLGCVYHGRPYVVPINYMFDGDSIFVHSLSGQKVEALRNDPRACIQVDEILDEYHWRSAIAFGTYEEVVDPETRARAVALLLERFPHLTPVESVPVHDGQSSIIVFRIRVDDIDGVREG
jgi:nitroimidazol reductase NimA-like FMN-containing flavoprotein (pyridoxamine 5'-phosphate oxidase superfamily)